MLVTAAAGGTGQIAVSTNTFYDGLYCQLLIISHLSHTVLQALYLITMYNTVS